MPLSAFQQFCADTGCPEDVKVMALWTQRNDAVAERDRERKLNESLTEAYEKVNFELGRVESEREMFVKSELHDKGPWTCSSDGRSIESDDFTHDVMLKVTGDFFSDEQRYAYSRNLADKLNAHPPVPDGKVLVNAGLLREGIIALEQTGFNVSLASDLKAMLKAAQQGE